MMDFECHITCRLSDAEKAADIVASTRWKTSEIARDPVLGDDTHFYLTTHDSSVEDMFANMNAAVRALRLVGVKVLRAKIEATIHDERYGL